MTDTPPVNNPQSDVHHPGPTIDPTTHLLAREALAGISGSIARQATLLKALVESPITGRLEFDQALEPLLLELVRLGRGLQDVARAIPRLTPPGQPLPPKIKSDALRAFRDVVNDSAVAACYLGLVLDACEGGQPSGPVLADAAAWAARLHGRLVQAVNKAREYHQGHAQPYHPTVH